jgi:hypothetical protein
MKKRATGKGGKMKREERSEHVKRGKNKSKNVH